MQNMISSGICIHTLFTEIG